MCGRLWSREQVAGSRWQVASCYLQPATCDLSLMPFGTIEQAIADLKNGKLVVVADDEDRENEGDLICAAQLVTPDIINFMTTHGRGLLCLALTPERCDQLELPQQVDNNTDEHATAFTVTIDADRRFGT